MIIIRKAKVQDVPRIAQLAVELLKYHGKINTYFAPGANAKETYAKYFRSCIYSSKKQLLVAELGDEIAGYALAQIALRPPVFKVKETGLVDDMYVLERFRRKGVATQLFAGLQDWIKNKKVKYATLKYIELSVNIKDDISHKFWAKLGFREYMSKQRMKI